MLYIVLICVAVSAAFVLLFLIEVAPGRNPVVAQRLAEMQAANQDTPATLQRRRRQLHSERLKGVLQAFGEAVQERSKNTSAVRLRLIQAGYPNAAAVRMVGQVTGSELQFNLYNAYSTSVDQSAAVFFEGNENPVSGSPNFLDAANGNFFPLPGSAAIDAALSEYGPAAIGDALFPISNQTLTAAGGIRNTTGRSNPFGGNGSFDDSREIVTLPGTPGRPFADQFVPAIPGTTGASFGPASNIATYAYIPITGERDKDGFLRIDDPSTATS